jgi:protein-S-isoprenylcysteine O-methyltransferase Ste14
MFLRALIAFIALPGVVAFLVPALVVARSAHPSHPGALGLAVLAAGSLVLLWCVREFYVAGKGTLAPWAPPVALVTGGLYRFTRNPMYVGVLLTLAGWAIAFRSPLLVVYVVAVAVAFHLRVVWGEEPALARTFGAEWQVYCRTVPRWPWSFARRLS